MIGGAVISVRLGVHGNGLTRFQSVRDMLARVAIEVDLDDPLPIVHQERLAEACGAQIQTPYFSLNHGHGEFPFSVDRWATAG